MHSKFLKPYDPAETEPRIYKLWEESGFFAPEAHPPRAGNPDILPSVDADKRGLDADRCGKKTTSYQLPATSFSIIMPPANANGSLHAGHALVMTIEDIMTRYKRMRGFKTLWLPWLDHAGFETQVVY